MGAARPEVTRELKMECGCWFVYSPDSFVRGERKFECRHGRVWMIRAVVAETTYVAEDVTKEDENGDE